MEDESNGKTNFNWCTWNHPKWFGKRAGGVRNRTTNGDHPNSSIIGQNTEKSPGDLSRLAVTQTPMKDHQVTLV